ncbi:MAG: STAS domain-containing protein [Pyrinomonadaceae bacterium]
MRRLFTANYQFTYYQLPNFLLTKTPIYSFIAVELFDDALSAAFKIIMTNQVLKENEPQISAQTAGATATVFASDYLNKITGEKIERECRKRLDAGCQTLVVNFKDTQIVNSIGVSILLGVIDAAAQANAKVIFSEVNRETIHLFEMLGLTRHVTISGEW